MSTPSLAQLGAELQSALEELQIVQSVSFGPGLESIASSKYSLTYRSAALESEENAKSNWFQKILKFFRTLMQRIKTWFANRKAAGEKNDIAKRVEDYKKAVASFRENAKTGDVETDTILRANRENSRFTELAKAADAAVDALLQDDKAFQGFGLSTSSLNLYVGLQKNENVSSRILEKMTRAGQELDAALEFFIRATDEATQGRTQARISIGSMLENIEKCSDDIGSAKEHIEVLQGANYAPKNAEEMLKAMMNFKFFNKLVDIPFVKDAGEITRQILDGSEETMKWLENVSNQNTHHSGNSLNDKIYAIGAETINQLAMTPAKLMTLVSKLEALENQCVPADPTTLFGHLGTALKKAAAEKVETKTPQERQFLNEYLKNTVDNKITTHFVNSGL